MAQMKVEDVHPRLVAVLRGDVPADEVGSFLTAAFAAVLPAVDRAGGSADGPRFAWYRGAPSDVVDVAGGYPVAGLSKGDLEGEIAVLERPGGMSAVALHDGPYDDLVHTYRELEVWLRDRALDVGEDSWEEYEEYAEDAGDGVAVVRIVWPLV